MDKNSPDLLPSVPQPQSPDRGEQYRAPQEAYGQRPDSYNEKEQSQTIERGVSVPGADMQQLPASRAAAPINDSGSSAAPVYAPADNTHPPIAEDSDLIEDEWVEKAKEIVERTRHDPYQQNKEVTLMKADYLKKRYNKDIKVSED